LGIGKPLIKRFFQHPTLKIVVFLSLLQNPVSTNLRFDAEALGFLRPKPCETPVFNGCSFKAEVLKEPLLIS
jgi:hypothetical protein